MQEGNSNSVHSSCTLGLVRNHPNRMDEINIVAIIRDKSYKYLLAMFSNMGNIKEYLHIHVYKFCQVQLLVSYANCGKTFEV